MTRAKPLPPADQRVAEILESARQAFAEKGFDGASMQDLARKAGMSVGNFYRYFPSKSGIVEALIAQDLADLERDFASILEQKDPLSALRATIAQRVAEVKCASDGQLWAEITAAALRKPEIGAAAQRMEEEIVGHMTQVFARATRRTWEEAQRQWSSHARLIVMLVKSCAMQRSDPSDGEKLEALVLRTINRTLDDITPVAARG